MHGARRTGARRYGLLVRSPSGGFYAAVTTSHGSKVYADAGRPPGS
jgi:hypothetical protein